MRYLSTSTFITGEDARQLGLRMSEVQPQDLSDWFRDEMAAYIGPLSNVENFIREASYNPDARKSLRTYNSPPDWRVVEHGGAAMIFYYSPSDDGRVSDAWLYRVVSEEEFLWLKESSGLLPRNEVRF